MKDRSKALHTDGNPYFNTGRRWGRALLAAGLILAAGTAWAGDSSRFSVEVESGAVFFSQNDVRIPGLGGDDFDLLSLTGTGPSPYVRVYASYIFNPRHRIRLLFAPLAVSGTGELEQPTFFEKETFAAGTPTTGYYRFNTYRALYRYTLHRCEKWEAGVGGAFLIRDAEISLRQGEDLYERNTDLGFVPLLHLYGARRLGERTALALDVEGLGGPQGRAIDAALTLRHEIPSGWSFSAGYRTVEGGADVNIVYTFAWLHYASLSAAYRF